MRSRHHGLALLAASLAAAVCSCRAPSAAEPPASPPAAPARSLKIATWNIAWLTTRDPRGERASGDYAALKRHADALDADVVALQEVDGAEAAGLVFDPQVYRFHFTRDGDNVQRAGFAWKAGIDVRPNPDLRSLATAGRRPGADVTVRWGGHELRLLAIHLKSGCPDAPLSGGDRDCTILRAQLPALEAWVDARAEEGIAYAVLGDFNRAFRDGDAFWRDLDDGLPPGADLTDAGTGARPACWNARHDRYINHIVLSPLAASWLVPRSFHELVFDSEADATGGLSDHCPLSVVLTAASTPGASPLPAIPARIPASEAAAHVGEVTTVCGRVISARYLGERSRMTFLNLDAPYPDQPFTVVIRAADRAAFVAPERSWKDERICVTGTVERYRGKPQIVARTPDQIRLDPPR